MAWGTEERSAAQKNSKRPRCGARSKHTGEPCRRWPVKGRTRCPKHGGKSPIGIAHSQFKHGKLCKYLPERLIDDFDAASKDPNLLELRQELALVDSRMMELIQMLDKQGNTQHFQDLKLVFDQMESLRASGENGQVLDNAIDRMGKCIQAGINNHAVWDDIGEQVDRRQRLTESERKRLSDTHQMISSERLMTLLAGVLKIIMEHVQDMKIRQAIRLELLQLLPDQHMTRAAKRAPKEIEGFKWILEGEDVQPEILVDAEMVNAQTG